MNTKRIFWICLIVLLTVLAGLQFAGQRALKRNDVRLDVHDELNYMNSAQENYMLKAEDGLFGYVWETLHTFKSRRMLAKEPATQLVSIPVILLSGGVDPDVLRQYAFLWLIPAALLLYLGLALLLRPLSALAGALLFVLSQCTLTTFLHWYQEITAIPAICALILAVCYEAKFGGRKDWGWLFTGIVIGLGALTKVSTVCIALCMFGILFVLSGWLDESRIRRMRLFKAGLLAYIPASFWWPAHFPYVLKYATAESFMKHGTLGRGLEHFAMFVRTCFSYMYGFWGSLLLLAAVVAAVFLFIGKLRRREMQVSPPAVVFLATVTPLLLIYLQIYRGNSMNPRFISVVIPLAAAAFAIVLDRAGRNRKALFAAVFGILILQGLSVFYPALRPDWKQDQRWVQPFKKTSVNVTDYSRLRSVAPLPKDGRNLRFGFVGNGRTFSPHLIQRGYYPHVQRIDEPMGLVRCDARNFETPLPTVSEALERARGLDYVVIALFRDRREFEDRIGSLEGLYFEKENSQNEKMMEALRQDGGFEGPELLSAAPGRGPDLAVFKNIRPPLTQ